MRLWEDNKCISLILGVMSKCLALDMCFMCPCKLFVLCRWHGRDPLRIWEAWACSMLARSCVTTHSALSQSISPVNCGVRLELNDGQAMFRSLKSDLVTRNASYLQDNLAYIKSPWTVPIAGWKCSCMGAKSALTMLLRSGPAAYGIFFSFSLPLLQLCVQCSLKDG